MRILLLPILIGVFAPLTALADATSAVTPTDGVESSPSCADTALTNAAWRENIFESILAADYESLDSTLPACVKELKKRGAHRCWHKHSTFFEHLLGVHNTLRLWGQGEIIARVGMFHSAYSNSYVDLALFDPNEDAEREIMKGLVGEKAEDLIHMFCIVDRQSVVVNTLLKNGFIPPEGMSVPHLRKPDETIFLSAETLRMLVVFTMADMSDQYFGWQDHLFGGEEMVNSMFTTGTDDVDSHDPTAIWPGLSQPGLWMSYISELGAVARTFVKKETDGDSDLVADLPPVLANCTKLLTRENEAKARDLYWSVMTGDVTESDEVIATLKEAIEFNPWAFEPHVILAQKYLHKNDFDAGKEAAARGLELQLQWGTAWDKRLSFSAWVAWTRVMHQRGEGRLEWPSNSWNVNNFGMVK